MQRNSALFFVVVVLCCWWGDGGTNAQVAGSPRLWAPCTHGKRTFSYTGGTQTFTIAAGACPTLTFSLWGAGGGGGEAGLGGAGGYATGRYTAVIGSTFNIMVGQGGRANNGMSGGAGGYSGGAAGGNGIYSHYGAGGGGGYSGIFGGSVSFANAVVIAAGGGGGASVVSAPRGALAEEAPAQVAASRQAVPAVGILRLVVRQPREALPAPLFQVSRWSPAVTDSNSLEVAVVAGGHGVAAEGDTMAEQGAEGITEEIAAIPLKQEVVDQQGAAAAASWDLTDWSMRIRLPGL